MSESLKPRFAVDFTEIERQLAKTQAAPAQPASASRNDPLAELARIVGQDDPFQSLLANDGSARPRQQSSSVDDLFAVRDSAPASREAQSRGRHSAPHEPDYASASYPQASPRGAEPAYGYHQPDHAAQGQAPYGNGGYEPEYYDEGGAQDAAYGQPEAQEYPLRQQGGRSRKGLVAVGVIVAATVVGVGGAYVFKGGSVTGGSGAPPLVMATNTPTKVQPQNPGGVEIPNQNKQIYERASQSTETKVVNREEQPVDVKQAVRMNGGAMADATGATAAPAAAGGAPQGGLHLGEPRKVRTVSIRPDGTVATPEPAAARPAAGAPLPTMTLPTEARSAPVQVASAQATPVAARPAASTPVAASSTPAAAKPVPAAATPTSGSSPQKPAQPVTVASAAAPAAAPATEAVTGGYAVQLGLSNSEEGANASLAQLKRKYSDLNSLPAMIRKAEVNGNTIFRVRVGPLSKDEASSLCSKLQGQGGQCFVAKN